MKFPLWRWAIGLVVGVAAASAQVVTYYVTGMVDDIHFGKGEDASLFGVRDTPHVFQAALTFDLTAHPQLSFVPAGGLLDDRTATHDFYFFPLETLTAATVTLGTQTWTAADLETDWVGATEFGVLADTALTTVPTYLLMSFRAGNGNRVVFGGLGYGTTVAMEGRLWMSDEAKSTDGNGSFTVSAVPEPSTYAVILGVCALIGVGSWRRWMRT